MLIKQKQPQLHVQQIPHARRTRYGSISCTNTSEHTGRSRFTNSTLCGDPPADDGAQTSWVVTRAVDRWSVVFLHVCICSHCVFGVWVWMLDVDRMLPSAYSGSVGSWLRRDRAQYTFTHSLTHERKKKNSTFITAHTSLLPARRSTAAPLPSASSSTNP